MIEGNDFDRDLKVAWLWYKKLSHAVSSIKQ